MTETWKSVPEYEGIYEVSDIGRVRSIDRVDMRGNRRNGRVLRSALSKRGYVMVVLCGKPRRATKKVHRLVLEAFVGPCGPDMEGCHFPDRNRKNNRLENLRWDTRSENQNDSKKHLTRKNDNAPKGEDSHFCKLTEHDVRRIFELRSTGMRQCDIGVEFGVHQQHVSQILSGKRWAHLGLAA